MANRHPNEGDPTKRSRKGTKLTLAFPSMPTFTRNPYEVYLIQKQKHHDVLKLAFKQTAVEITQDVVTGLPVQFKWTQNSVEKVWYGYVSYVATSVRANQDGTMDVVCVGASWPLKERATRVFVESTITDAVASIAKQFGLEFVGDAHPRVFPQLIIAGQSYWSWIQEQADRVGYAAYVEGTTLYFRKLDTVITQNSSSIPIFSLQDPSIGLDAQSLVDRTLTTFKIIKGDYIEGEDDLRTSMVSGGVNPFTLEAITAAASPSDVGANMRADNSAVLFSEYRTDQVVTSKSEADLTSKDLAQKSRFTTPAKIRGIGDYRCTPYGLLQVLGTGKITDGYWLVKEVVHYFIMYGQYEVEMTVLSDGLGDSQVNGFEMGKSVGRNIVNISEALGSNSSQATARAGQPPTLQQTLIPQTPTELTFSPQSARWKA